MFGVCLLFIILATTTSYTDLAPFLGLLFMVQYVMLYFFLRVRYAIQLPLMWCCSCTEQRHLRFHTFVGLFSIFVLICDAYDMFKAMVSQDGLY